MASAPHGPEHQFKAGAIVPRGAAGVRPLYEGSRILKAGAIELEQLKREFEAYRAEKLAEIEQMRERALDEIQQLKAENEESLKVVRKRAASSVKRSTSKDVEELLVTLDAAIEKARAEFALEAKRLALRYAKAIVAVELTTRPEVIVDMIERVVQSAKNYKEITIHVNPEDFDIVDGSLERIKKSLPLANAVKVNKKRDVPRHGVRIEHEGGGYEGSAEAQLKAAHEKLLEEINKLKT